MILTTIQWRKKANYELAYQKTKQLLIGWRWDTLIVSLIKQSKGGERAKWVGDDYCVLGG